MKSQVKMLKSSTTYSPKPKAPLGVFAKYMLSLLEEISESPPKGTQVLTGTSATTPDAA